MLNNPFNLLPINLQLSRKRVSPQVHTLPAIHLGQAGRPGPRGWGDMQKNWALLIFVASHFHHSRWAGACEGHPIVDIWQLWFWSRGREVHWWRHRAPWWRKWRCFYVPHWTWQKTLDCHRLWHQCHRPESWDFQPTRMLWRANSERWRPDCGQASNFWQWDVFLWHPPWPFSWTCYWWATDNHLRSKDLLMYQ